MWRVEVVSRDRPGLLATVSGVLSASGLSVHEAVIARVTDAAAAIGLARLAMTPSAITGATGNQEYFLHLRKLKVKS